MRNDIRNYAQYQINYHRTCPFKLATLVAYRQPKFKSYHGDLIKVLVIVGFIVVGMIVSFQ